MNFCTNACCRNFHGTRSSYSWTRTLFVLAGLVVFLGGLTACSKKEPVTARRAEPPREPAATTTASVPAAATESLSSPAGVEPEPDRPRPAALVVVEGGPDDNTIWRGWPVLVRAIILKGETQVDLSVQGPAEIAFERHEDIWVISPATSAQLTRGTYTFMMGTDRSEVVVTDPPSDLSPEQRTRLRGIAVQAELVQGHLDAARQAAQEWTAAEPKSPVAFTVLGDLRYSTGDRRGAALAYNEAIRHIPSNVRPPGHLFGRVAELMSEMVDVPPGKSAGSVSSRATPLTVLPEAAFTKPESANKPAPPSSSSSGAIISTVELIDAQIIADAAGQWAASATAGSQYGKTQYSASKATGAPSVAVVGNSPDAWCPASKTSGTDWLEVTFTKPVYALEVRVRQNDAAGAIARIEAFEADGTAHVWWEGVDPYKAPAVREIVWFAVRVPKTSYLVAKVKITLNLAAGPGYKEIDAVQLVGDGP